MKQVMAWAATAAIFSAVVTVAIRAAARFNRRALGNQALTQP